VFTLQNEKLPVMLGTILAPINKHIIAKTMPFLYKASQRGLFKTLNINIYDKKLFTFYIILALDTNQN
jgi:hypothetical protein